MLSLHDSKVLGLVGLVIYALARVLVVVLQPTIMHPSYGL
jgi:hypothetical protein